CILVLFSLPPISTLFPYTTLFRSELVFRALGEPEGPLVFLRLHRLLRLGEDLPQMRGRDPESLCELEPRAGRQDFLGRGIEDRRSEEHTSELQSLRHLVCRLLLEK